MKLRRAMAVAAATAAIAPAALLAAPAAYATDPTPSVSATESAAGEETTGTSASPSVSSSGSTDSTESAKPSDEDEDESGQSDETDSDSGTPGDESSASPSASPSASTSPSTSAPAPSASESAPAKDEDPDLCLDEEGANPVELSAELSSGLASLPETVVAGSGWTAFSFNVSNRGDEEIKNIKPMIGVAAIGWDEEGQDYSGQISVQVFDKAAGKWSTLADAAGEGATFAAFSLGAGQSVSYQLRLSVSGKVPDSLGLTGGFASYADADGCWLADDPNGWIYFFDILAAGSDAGEPNDAKPQTGGRTELDKVSDVKVTGSLAETGSSSALPMIGLVGGAAVVAGAGAVFVVRRRKAGTEA